MTKPDTALQGGPETVREGSRLVRVENCRPALHVLQTYSATARCNLRWVIGPQEGATSRPTANCASGLRVRPDQSRRGASCCPPLPPLATLARRLRERLWHEYARECSQPSCARAGNLSAVGRTTAHRLLRRWSSIPRQQGSQQACGPHTQNGPHIKSNIACPHRPQVCTILSKHRVDPDSLPHACPAARDHHSV